MGMPNPEGKAGQRSYPPFTKGEVNKDYFKTAPKCHPFPGEVREEGQIHMIVNRIN